MKKTELLKNFVSQYDWGQDYALPLYRIARRHSGKKALDIGTGWGISSYAFYLAGYDVITIDVEYKQVPEGITFVQGDVKDVLLSLKDRQFDLIYIDSGHSYEEVKRDFELVSYHDLLTDGGIIIFDDYANCDGVKRFIDELDYPKKFIKNKNKTCVVAIR